MTKGWTLVHLVFSRALLRPARLATFEFRDDALESHLANPRKHRGAVGFQVFRVLDQRWTAGDELLE
jgi:hypothetical protein